MSEGAFETTFAAELEYSRLPYILTALVGQPTTTGENTYAAYRKSFDNAQDALQVWNKAKQEGSKPMRYDHTFNVPDIKITFDSAPYKKQVKDYLDPNGCHQCYVLRSKYVKLAGLKVDQTLGAEAVALVRCPKHEREYISEIKRQLTEAIAKIG